MIILPYVYQIPSNYTLLLPHFGKTVSQTGIMAFWAKDVSFFQREGKTVATLSKPRNTIDFRRNMFEHSTFYCQFHLL